MNEKSVHAGGERLIVRTLSALELRKKASRGLFGVDSPMFWPGLKSYFVSRISKRNTQVVAALTSKGLPVCWASFGPNRLDRSIWSYGNLFTLPDYRRHGLARSVVGAVIEMVRKARGRHVYCFIDVENKTSARMHMELGFQFTGLKKSNVQIVEDFSGYHNRAATCIAVESRELCVQVQNEFANSNRDSESPDANFVLQYLLPEQSMLAWKRPSSRNCIVELTSGAALYLREERNEFSGLLRHGEAQLRMPELGAALQSSLGCDCPGRFVLFHTSEKSQSCLGKGALTFRVYALDATSRSQKSWPSD